MRTDIRPFGQLDQDLIVLAYLNHKKDGRFLDIGCGTPYILSNTARLEKEYNWSGVAIDITEQTDEWSWSDRPNTKLIIDDATSIDYNDLFNKYFTGQEIDFLSLDLEPPPITIDVLFKLPLNQWKPKVIAIEPDSYRDDHGTDREKVILDYMISLGYSLRAKLYPRLEHLLVTDTRCQDHIYVRKDIIVSET